MKELSTEEKAKRYDEALTKARNIVSSINVGLIGKDSFEAIFPELAESEDERIRKSLIILLQHFCKGYRVPGLDFPVSYKDMLAWLEKQGEQKPADKAERKGMNIVEEDMTPFQKKVFCIIDTTIEEEQGLKQVCDELLRLAHDEIEQTPAWSEEDEIALGDALWCCKQAASIAKDENDMGNIWYAERWLKSLKDRVQPKQEWSEDDERYLNNTISYLKDATEFKETAKLCIDWLKSLSPQNRWKPSDEQMEALDDFIYAKYPNIEKYGAAVKSLYQDLKKLRED